MKKIFKKYIQTDLLPFFIQLFVRFIYLTNKKTYHQPKDGIPKDNFIVCMWHGDLLMQPFNYLNFKKDGDVRAIISEHRDGITIRRTVEHLGIGSFSGSSTRGGAKALIGAIKALKSGTDVAITPDGPKGPIYSVADGIVMISQKTKAKILPFSCVPTKYWTMKSWDKFIIPKPFGTIDFYIGEPFDLNGLEMDEAKKLIQEKMMENQIEK
jgi:lysophospholipid acyltransferase (LPLAT)-like uncharacterized protein